jgi:hypothetical protein
MARLDIKERLHGAIYRGNKKATEEEVAEVAALITLVIGELVSELAEVLVDLEVRVAALEAS